MRQISVAATALLVLLTLSVSPARADSVVVASVDLPSSMHAVQAACDDQGRPSGAPEPATAWLSVEMPSAPLGSKSLVIQPEPGTLGGLEIHLASADQLATLGVASYDTRFLSVQLGSGGPHHSIIGTHDSTTGWYAFHADGAGDGLGDGPLDVYLWFGDCSDSGRSVHVDALSFGAAGDVTTYDFEYPSVHAGSPGNWWATGVAWRGVNCTLNDSTSHGLPLTIEGERLVVEARPHGSGAFRRIGAGATDQYGQVAVRDRPTRNTDYRCRYAGNPARGFPASVSDPTALAVATYLTIHAHRTNHGRRVLVTGTATPRHPGTPVALHLRRITWDIGRSRTIDRGRLSRHGDYRLTAPLRPGTWELFVSVAKAPGNAAGPSVSRYVK
ncbi:hypothetical protein [Nocardioides conyzicola]|uniref:WRKY domain-containing protein n=1 Tax=Nocardioides conyzicola TaxID=1651781 RepID=A0ABP8Y7A7_9ACTN